MVSVDRSVKIANEIKKALAESLHTEIKDPRLSPMAAVTNIELTRDLRFAKVYISVYDTDELKKSSIDALNHAEGFLKHVVASKVDIRTLPKMTFLLDDSARYYEKISKLLDEVNAKDERNKS